MAPSRAIMGAGMPLLIQVPALPQLLTVASAAHLLAPPWSAGNSTPVQGPDQCRLSLSLYVCQDRARTDSPRQGSAIFACRGGSVALQSAASSAARAG